MLHSLDNDYYENLTRIVCMFLRARRNENQMREKKAICYFRCVADVILDVDKVSPESETRVTAKNVCFLVAFSSSIVCLSLCPLPRIEFSSQNIGAVIARLFLQTTLRLLEELATMKSSTVCL